MRISTFDKKISLLITFFVLYNGFKCATCLSTGSGDWAVAASWSCGHVPTCGDSIVILPTHTITISSQQNYNGCALRMALSIQGTLVFVTGNKLDLPCNSKLYLFPGGHIDPGSGGGNSNLIDVCNTTYWNAGDGAITGPSCMPPAGCPVALPIELSSFTATLNDSEVGLLWTTESERNNLKFDVERSSDASSFIKIASENSKANNGNSQLPITYFSSDQNPLQNNNYYRLKQIDRDQSFTYSQIISVSLLKGKNIKFIIYPNPNHGEFTADISGIENNHNVGVFLYDQNGALHYKSNFFIQDSQNSKIQIIPENKLANGVYICAFVVEEVSFKVKVVVN